VQMTTHRLEQFRRTSAAYASSRLVTCHSALALMNQARTDASLLSAAVPTPSTLTGDAGDLLRAIAREAR